MHTGAVARKKISNIWPESPEANLVVEVERSDLPYEVVVERPLTEYVQRDDVPRLPASLP